MEIAHLLLPEASLFPNNKTIKLFIDICNRDGFTKTVSEIFKEKDINNNYLPVFSYLKLSMKTIGEEEGNSDIDMESFVTGFLCCFHLFRLQLESEDMLLDDVQANIGVLNSYVTYLEDEICNLKNSDGN